MATQARLDLLANAAAVVQLTGGTLTKALAMHLSAVLPAPVSSDPFAQPLSTGTPAITDPSGQPMPVGDLPGWHQTFADDFTTDVPLGGFSGCSQAATLMASSCTGLPASVASKWWALACGRRGWPRRSADARPGNLSPAWWVQGAAALWQEDVDAAGEYALRGAEAADFLTRGDLDEADGAVDAGAGEEGERTGASAPEAGQGHHPLGEQRNG